MKIILSKRKIKEAMQIKPNQTMAIHPSKGIKITITNEEDKTLRIGLR